jgi:hypothetical protein
VEALRITLPKGQGEALLTVTPASQPSRPTAPMPRN